MRSKCILCLLIFLLLWTVALPVSAAETSGVCGADVDAWLDSDPANEGGNLWWNFDVATGTLTISGRGVMFSDKSTSRWVDWQEQITRVVVEEGCYTIAKGAFYGCQNLTSVTLPSTVRAINESAFYGCKGLKEIQLPEALQEVGEHAFRESGLRQIEIPPKVKNIGIHAFRDCVSLEKITFLGLPPSLATGVFSGITASVYYPENPNWTAVKGKLLGGEITWVEVPCPGHQPEILPAQEATCSQIGLTAGVRCSLCFATLTPQEQLPMEAHNFGLWVVAEAPPQWGNGLARRCCTVCGVAQTKEISSTTVLNPVVPTVMETPITPPTAEAPVTPPTTQALSATDTPEVSADTEEITTSTQVQTAPIVPTSADPQADVSVQEDSVFQWWVIMLIAGVILLGGGLTAMILFRGGISVFKKK